MVTRFIVRDVRTKGCDYLAWGDDDEVGARTTLAETQALFGEDAVEMVAMPAHGMDDHTRRLIEGECQRSSTKGPIGDDVHDR